MAEKFFQAMIFSFGIPSPLRSPTPSKTQPPGKNFEIMIENFRANSRGPKISKKLVLDLRLQFPSF